MSAPSRFAWDEAPEPPEHRRFAVEPFVLGGAAVASLIWLVIQRHDVSPVSFIVPVVLVVAGVLNLASRRIRQAFTALARRLGSVIGSAAGFVCFNVLGAVVVLGPWLYQRTVRIDPLGPSGGWVACRRRNTQPARPWAPDASMADRSAGQRLRSTAAAVLVVAAVVFAIPSTRAAIGRFWRPPAQGPQPFLLDHGPASQASTGEALRNPVPPGIKAAPHLQGQPFAAHRNDPWFYGGTFSAPQGWALDPPQGVWRPQNLHRFGDFQSEWVSVIDGHRKSWTPPACSCRRLKVWVYGGSTTYGLDQRDEHTIPSELARTAYAHGLTIDVSNRGMPGDVHWLEAEQFAWDLTQEPPPDLVVFYDGVNDAANTYGYTDIGVADVKAPENFTMVDVWRSTGRSKGPVPKGPPGSEYIGYSTNKDHTMAQIAMRKYNQARRLSSTTARMHHVAMRYVWQPDRFTRPLVLSEPHFDTVRENSTRLQEQAVDDLIPKDVIDLTGALDGTRDPIYTDDVHHNEEGARLIAEALYARIASELQLLERG